MNGLSVVLCCVEKRSCMDFGWVWVIEFRENGFEFVRTTPAVKKKKGFLARITGECPLTLQVPKRIIMLRLI